MIQSLPQLMAAEPKKCNLLFKKSLIFSSSKQEFDKIVSENNQNSQLEINFRDQNQENYSRKFLFKTQQPSTQLSQIIKQEIVVPNCGKLPEDKIIKGKIRNNYSIKHQGYFRSYKNLVLPNPNKYELQCQDMQFVKGIKSRFKFNKKYKFQTKTFIDVLESCQENLHRVKNITLEDSCRQILNYLSFNLPVSLLNSFTIQEKQQLSKLLIEIVNHWKKLKAQNQGFPLFRKHWPRNDITISRYDFWVPYKYRSIEESKKRKFQYQLRNGGKTQKEDKITKFTQENSIFLYEIQQTLQVHTHNKSKFSKQTAAFHKLALQYGFKCPQYLIEVVEEKHNSKLASSINKLSILPYFKNPFVKVSDGSSRLNKMNLSTQYQVIYDPRKRNATPQIIQSIQGGKEKIRSPHWIQSYQAEKRKCRSSPKYSSNQFEGVPNKKVKLS